MIPTLVTEAGVPIWESNAVVRFLDERYGFADGTEALDPAAMALAANCAAALETISFQCCPLLSDKGFGALVDACPRLRHITLKHCDVSDESIARAEAFNEQLQVRRVDSGKPLEVGSVGSYEY